MFIVENIKARNKYKRRIRKSNKFNKSTLIYKKEILKNQI